MPVTTIALLVASVAASSASPLVFGRRDPMPETPKYWGYTACISALQSAPLGPLLFLSQRPETEALTHTRHYRFPVLERRSDRTLRLYVGCTTTRDGRKVLSLVVGPEAQQRTAFGADDG